MKITKKSSGLKGKALVRVKGNKIQVTYEDSKPIVLDKPDWWPSFRGGKLYVKLNKDGDEILTAAPLDGMFDAKFKGFYALEGEPPAPREIEDRPVKARDGRSFVIEAHREFSPVLTIIGPAEYVGMSAIDNLYYFFVNDNGAVGVEGYGKALEKVEAFFEATGIVDARIKFSDNVLPALQKAIRSADRTFKISMENGYVKNYIEGFDAEEGDADWENGKPDAETEEDDDDWLDSPTDAKNDADIPF